MQLHSLFRYDVSSHSFVTLSLHVRNALMADVLLVQLNSMSCGGVKEEDMGMPTKAADVECRVC